MDDVQRYYKFIPKDDITPLEAAWCAVLLDCAHHVHDFHAEEWPNWNIVKRHFVLDPTWKITHEAHK